jgi:heat shock protein HtpX
MNNMKTFILMAGLTALLVVIGRMIGGTAGAIIALVFSAVSNFASYWFSDKIVLSMYKATPLEDVNINAMVDRLTKVADMPRPKVYVMHSPQPNAFATGRNPAKGVVCLSDSIIEMLTPDELEGVIAHEMGHIHNRDTLVMTQTATIAGAIAQMTSMFGMFGGMMMRRGNDDGNEERQGANPIAMIAAMILAPMAAMFVQMAISRTREYGADRFGAITSGKPMALASALAKISGAATLPTPATPATAHLFISNPIQNISGMFSTHPPIPKRIAALEKIADEIRGGAKFSIQQTNKEIRDYTKL